jgi:hypothetical protein
VFLINRQLTDPAARPLSDEPATFSSPATDPAYDFTVEVYYRKTDMNRRCTSPWLDERERIRTSVLVRETTREVSREYSIYKPGTAEQAINAELVRRLGEGGRAGRSVWSARVEVRPPDEVREMLRTDLKGRYEIQSRARANGLLLEMTDQLNQRWAAFLKSAPKTPAAPYALKLADKPENLAEVLRACSMSCGARRPRRGPVAVIPLAGAYYQEVSPAVRAPHRTVRGPNRATDFST